MRGGTGESVVFSLDTQGGGMLLLETMMDGGFLGKGEERTHAICR